MLDWLLTCRASNPEDARRGRLLNWFILIFLTITLLNIGTVIFSDTYLLGIIVVVMVALLLFIYFLNRKGKVRLVAPSLVATLFVVLHILSIMPTGEIVSAGASPSLLAVPVALAGIMLSKRTVSLVMGLAVADSLWLLLVGIPQLEVYRTEHSEDMQILVSLTLTVLVTVGLVASFFSQEIQHFIVSIQGRNRELEQTNLALEMEKEKLAITLDSSGEGIITTGRTGHIELINNVAEKLTGWTQVEARGLPLAEVFCLLDHKTRFPTQAPFQNLNLDKSVISSTEDFTLSSRTGKECYVNYTISLIPGQHNSSLGSVLIFHDVTERRKIDEERLKANNLESLGLLAGGIAHDFNNILTGINGNIALARNDLNPSQDAYYSLKAAEAATMRARDLAKQLLTFAIGGAPVKQTARLNEIILETAHFVLHGSRVEGDFDIPSSLWAVEVDPGQISQVIQNLVLNAAQAMPEGGKVSVEAANVTLTAGSVPLLKAGDFVKIRVQDQGCGIKPDVMDKIFNPYFSTKAHNSGMGLAVCYSIIRKHDGQILVESEPGKGTTMTLYLPKSNQELKEKAIEVPPKDTRTDKHLRVLIMDDEVMIRNVATKALTRKGYQVSTVEDGNLAIEEYQKALEEGRPYKVVIMDLTIPGGVGGKEATQKLLKLDPKAKVVVSSGYSTDPVMAHYEEYGFAGILYKPFNLSSLEQIIQVVSQD